MFKRVTWMGIGMAVGATGAFRAKRKLEEAVDRYLPEQVADRAAASARGLSHTVKAAASEGRAAMRATEAELRARVEARTFVGERPVEQPAAATGSARPATGGGVSGSASPERRGAPRVARRAGRASTAPAGAAGPRRRARR